jgi:hypothetical protein
MQPEPKARRRRWGGDEDTGETREMCFSLRASQANRDERRSSETDRKKGNYSLEFLIKGVVCRERIR